MCHCHQKKQTHPAPLTACFHPHLCASTNVCAANWSSLNLTLPSLPLPQVRTNLNPVHHITIQVFACTKKEAAERGGNKQDHVFQWWSWSIPADHLCEVVGCRLEPPNISLTLSGLCSVLFPPSTHTAPDRYATARSFRSGCWVNQILTLPNCKVLLAFS